MRTRSKRILAALTASLLMGLVVHSASAGRLSLSDARFRVSWNRLVISDQEFGGEFGIRQTCRVTLEGSFHSATIRKVPGALIGVISRGIIDSTNCRGTDEPQRATILRETLPWHLTYESFGGILPNISKVSLLLRRYAFQVSAVFSGIPIQCLYSDGGLPEENQVLRLVRQPAGEVFELNIVTGRRASLFRGSMFTCPSFSQLEGDGQIFLLETPVRIDITLI
jgi:hypothetical protein